MRRPLALIVLLLAALSLAPSWAHVLEAQPRLADWPAGLWRDATVLHRQFAWFAIIGAPIDLAAVAAAALLAWRERGRPGFRLLLAGAGLLGLGLAAWLAIVAPANAVLATWGAGPIPSDFAAVRDRWESGHMIAAACKLAAFACLAAALVAPGGGRDS